MSDRISQKIDTYAKTHLKELRGKEEGRYKLTKYDVAQLMLSSGQLSQADFASWMNTQEGYESQTITTLQKQAVRTGSIFSFDNPLTPEREEAYLDSLDNAFYREPLTGLILSQTTKSKPAAAKASKTFQKDAEIREETVNILLNNAKQALVLISQYHNSIGMISSDAFVQGMNVIGNSFWDSWSGRNDFVTVFENEDAVKEQIKNLESLKTKVKKPMEFEREFKKLFGVDFKAENFEKLADANKKLNEMNAYSGMSEYFKYGIEQLKSNEDLSQFDLEALLSPVFGNDTATVQAYIAKLRKNSTDEEDFRNKLISILQNSKQGIDKELAGFNRAEIEKDFATAYKSAMGDYKSDEIISNYIQSSKMMAMLSETGFVIAGSFMMMGSKAVLNLSSKALNAFGNKLGAQAMKLGMTTLTASAPAAETVVGGLTSRDGMSLERGEQAWEELKNGLMYGSFGAYVSGPLGNLVSKVLSKNPQIFSQIVASQKFTMAAGAAAETTADVLFDRIKSDLTFKE